MAQNGANMTKQKYIVMVDDNFHFMDESERYSSGAYTTYEEAVEKCKQIVNEFLEDAISPKDSADSLYTTWLMYGENPFVDGGTENYFSSSQYAKKRCEVLTRQ